MKKAMDSLYSVMQSMIVFLLASLVLLVFTNAFARYVFGNSIMMADELARFMFIWLTFIGAAVAHRNHQHLGMQLLVSAMPPATWKYFMVVSDVLVLACCILFIWGGVLVWNVNMTFVSPVLQIPLAYVHGIAVVTVGLMACSTVDRIYRTLTGRLTEHELRVFADKEEDSETAAVKGGLE